MSNLCVGQMDVPRFCIFFGVIGGGRLRNCKDRSSPRQEGQCDLAWSCTVRLGNSGEHCSTNSAGAGKIAVTERTIGRDRDIVRFAPR